MELALRFRGPKAPEGHLRRTEPHWSTAVCISAWDHRVRMDAPETPIHTLRLSFQTP